MVNFPEGTFWHTYDPRGISCRDASTELNIGGEDVMAVLNLEHEAGSYVLNVATGKLLAGAVSRQEAYELAEAEALKLLEIS